MSLPDHIIAHAVCCYLSPHDLSRLSRVNGIFFRAYLDRMRKILTVNPEIVVGVGLVGDSLLLDSFLRVSKRDLSAVFPEAVERGVIHRDLRTLHDLYTGAGELQPIFDREIKRLSSCKEHMEFLSSRDVVVWCDKHLVTLWHHAYAARYNNVMEAILANLPLLSPRAQDKLLASWLRVDKKTAGKIRVLLTTPLYRQKLSIFANRYNQS